MCCTQSRGAKVIVGGPVPVGIGLAFPLLAADKDNPLVVTGKSEPLSSSGLIFCLYMI